MNSPKPIKLIDTHAHLLDKAFDQDRAIVIKNADEHNVKSIIEIACEPKDWQPVLDFTSSHKQFRAGLGIHPHEAKDATNEHFETLKRLSADPKVVGIGETGFDYYYNHSPKDIQKDIFIRHIELSNALKKPLIIHCRDAYTDLIDILTAHRSSLNEIPGVVHCFSGSTDDVKKLFDMGFIIGINGPVTYPKATQLREVVSYSPIDMMVLETDAPYLPPQQYRGKRNETAYLEIIGNKIAEIKECVFEKVAEATTINAIRVFNLES